MAENKILLNFGSAHDRKDGFKNVDALKWGGNTDIIWDMNNFPYPFEIESVDEIRSVENLEHISFRNVPKVLSEWFRILKIGGTIDIQVPDCGSMMEMYAHDEICKCVAHKPQKPEDYKGKPDCPNCAGFGRVNPNRWLFAFCGAQKHPYDTHLSIFTQDILEDLLVKAGFKDILFNNELPKWKIKAKARK